MFINISNLTKMSCLVILPVYYQYDSLSGTDVNRNPTLLKKQKIKKLLLLMSKFNNIDKTQCSALLVINKTCFRGMGRVKDQTASMFLMVIIKKPHSTY